MSNSSKPASRRDTLRNRENGLVVHENGKEEKKPKDGELSTDQQEQRSKLRDRQSIPKPETLQYEPNFIKGIPAKIMQSILSDAAKHEQKGTKSSNKSQHTPKRKSETKAKQNEVKKSKSEVKQQEEVFDSYAFSMQLINTEDERLLAHKSKDYNEKNVLLIGNLPQDVTREQLEEHFRKTGGIKTIRIPRERGSDKGRGIAYMEFDGRISLGIALRLHNTTLGGRQINVDFYSTGGGKTQQGKHN